MATTHHLGLTLVEQSQAQKEVTVNRALSDIDAVLNTGVVAHDVAIPPESPSDGDVYIVAASATDEWSGHADEIAYFDQVWWFITPREGLKIWHNADDQFYIYDGSGWIADTDASRHYDAAQTVSLKTLTDGATIAWDVEDAQVAQVTLAGNRTLGNPSNARAGGTYLLIVKQDATGSRTLSYGGDYAFPDGGMPTLSTDANAVDVLSFIYDGSKMLGVAQLDFS